MRRRLGVLAIGMLLSGCGLSDQYSIMPEPLRHSQQSKSYFPDFLGAAKTNGRSLLPETTGTIEISEPFYVDHLKSYQVCARQSARDSYDAVVAVIMRTEFISRRRALAEDQCELRDYTAVKVD